MAWGLPATALFQALRCHTQGLGILRPFAVASVLAEQGITVARRTIAKYRESLGIPPSNERKRLI